MFIFIKFKCLNPKKGGVLRLVESVGGGGTKLASTDIWLLGPSNVVRTPQILSRYAELDIIQTIFK